MRKAITLRSAVNTFTTDRGRLPSTLDALVPEYLQYIPLASPNGDPFEYVTDGANGSFTLLWRYRDVKYALKEQGEIFIVR